jgi:hypothetical protein
MTAPPPTVRFEGAHASLSVRSLLPDVVAIEVSGADVGELGDAPFRALKERMSHGPVELFIDARAARGVAIDVSGDWAMWLRAQRPRLRRVTMLTRTPFVDLTARFVRRFAGLEEVMEVGSDARAYDAALARALAG